MVTLIDFSKFAMNRLKLDKITKADLVGPVYKLLKGTCKSDRCPYDLSKPLPLQGSPSHLTIPVDFFFNNDLEYLKTGSSERKYIVSITKIKTARYELKFIEEMIPRKWSLVKVAYNRDAELILSVTRVKVDKQYGYGYLEEIVVRRADRKEYTFKEGDFKRLHLNDIEICFYYKFNNKLVSDLLFSNGTLKSVYEILHYRLLNFKLGYNKDMPKRKWIDEDQNQTYIMMIALSLRPRISSKNSISQAGLTGVADSVAVNDSATCDTSPVGRQRATSGFAPAILSNPVDVIKDRVMKGRLIVRLTQLRRKCRRCSTIRPQTLRGLAFGAQAIFNCLENLAESNYGLLRNMF
ncbi:hypothetical protein Tco_1005145 [Tanacetum coccineum]|uniref:Uncharacterized protein n=1 Tax=Tanacetum coccineum TaxID=301880 RepID=A0ABQ5FGC5_9ASTR